MLQFILNSAHQRIHHTGYADIAPTPEWKIPGGAPISGDMPMLGWQGYVPDRRNNATSHVFIHPTHQTNRVMINESRFHIL